MDADVSAPAGVRSEVVLAGVGGEESDRREPLKKSRGNTETAPTSRAEDEAVGSLGRGCRTG